MEVIFSAICEMMELQKGEEIKKDLAYGVLNFIIALYGSTWAFHFTALEMDYNRCGINLEIVKIGDIYEDEDSDEDGDAYEVEDMDSNAHKDDHSEAYEDEDSEAYEDEDSDEDGDERCLDNIIRREYALLDALLLIGTPFETAYRKA